MFLYLGEWWRRITNMSPRGPTLSSSYRRRYRWTKWRTLWQTMTFKNLRSALCLLGILLDIQNFKKYVSINEVRRKKNIQIYFILFLSLQNVQQLGLISTLYYCKCLLQYGQWSSGQAPTEVNKMPVSASYLGQSNWTVWDVR